MKFGVVTFPGSNCDQDVLHVLETVLEQEVVSLWHKETELPNFDVGDCVILPGGFAYGDYLRAGAIARFSPIMQAVIYFANNGGYVWGICNGFQILCEAGLLPGVLMRNNHQKFVCKNIFLKTVTNHCVIASQIDPNLALKIPIAHAEGQYFADEATIRELKENDQILFQYCTKDGEVIDAANPNGSVENIAGICNKNRNVFGLMPHPERAAEEILGNRDGKLIFDSFLANAKVEMAANGVGA